MGPFAPTTIMLAFLPNSIDPIAVSCTRQVNNEPLKYIESYKMGAFQLCLLVSDPQYITSYMYHTAYLLGSTAT